MAPLSNTQCGWSLLWVAIRHIKLLNNAWAYKMAVKYRRLSYYPWLPVEPDLPRPDPLAKYQYVFNCSLPIEENPWPRYGNIRPPAWTFLWAWRRQ